MTRDRVINAMNPVSLLNHFSKNQHINLQHFTETNTMFYCNPGMLWWWLETVSGMSTLIPFPNTCIT
jgi:hypothetical protein